MRKIILVMFFCAFLFIISTSLNSVYAESYTTYESIIFENEGIVMLDSWSYLIESSYMNKLSKGKMFGWNVFYSYKKEPFTFISETLYHVKNSGLKEITHTFKYEESEELQIQRSVKGNLEVGLDYTKEQKKISKFKFGLESKLEFEYKETSKNKTTKTDTVKIIIAPNSELFIKVQGKGYLYQGVAKKYFLFITTKSGGFEYCIITTEYYSIDMTIIDQSLMEYER